MALEEATGDTGYRRRRQTGWEVNQGWKKPSETQIIVVDDSQGWKKQEQKQKQGWKKQKQEQKGLSIHDEQPRETQIDDDTPTELEEGDDDSVFAELTHGAPPPPRARIRSAGSETLAEVGNIVGECGDLVNKIAKSTQLQPKDVKSVLAALQTIAHADLKKRGKLVILGLRLKHRRVFNGRMHGNFRLEAMSD
jgi:hypothetical protein